MHLLANIKNDKKRACKALFFAFSLHKTVLLFTSSDCEGLIDRKPPRTVWPAGEANGTMNVKSILDEKEKRNNQIGSNGFDVSLSLRNGRRTMRTPASPSTNGSRGVESGWFI